jgi:hypothetical protein
MTAFKRCCTKCSEFKEQKGGGIRFILGLRQWVCAICKKKIDDSKK